MEKLIDKIDDSSSSSDEEPKKKSPKKNESEEVFIGPRSDKHRKKTRPRNRKITSQRY